MSVKVWLVNKKLLNKWRWFLTLVLEVFLEIKNLWDQGSGFSVVILQLTSLRKSQHFIMQLLWFFLQNDAWGTGNRNSTLTMWHYPYLGRSACDWLRQIPLWNDQSEVLPRQQHVISTEFLFSLLSRYFAGKKVLANSEMLAVFSG